MIHVRLSHNGTIRGDAHLDELRVCLDDPSKRLLTRIFDMKREAVTLRRVVSPELEELALLMSPASA